MFNHVMLGSNDLEASKKFYDALIGSMGGKPGRSDPMGRLVYAHEGGVLMVSKPINGEPACGANGGTLGFKVNGPEQAQAWHKAGVENGGTTCEDPPGERAGSNGPIYLAYLRDPDGNKLCAVHRMAK